MALPPTNTEPLPEPRRSVLDALIWGVACAACASGCWTIVHSLLTTYDVPPNPILLRLLADAAGRIATTGAVSGLISGAVAGLTSAGRGSAAIVLGFGGAFVGALGGGLALPTVFLLRKWIDPLASVALLWCLIGFFAGTGAYCCSETGNGVSEHERSIEARVAHALSLCSLLGFVFFILFTIATTRY